MSCKKSHQLLLKLDDSLHFTEKKIRDELSSVVRTGEYLWLAFDEGHGLERLKRVKDTYQGHQTFSLTEYMHLPEGKDEVDIEGLAYDGTYIWIVGSHSTKRGKPDERKDSLKKRIKCLAKVKNDPNRHTLARIPVLKDPETGEYTLYKSCPDPKNPGQFLTASRLKANKTQSQLTKALKKDKHFQPFMDIPGKDNGLDIEGIAVMGERIFLGLRGPVLRGWAIILEVQVKQKGKDTLKLKKIGKHKQRYRKHMVNLHGMGIRELAVAQDDLLILAGPTMDCDGTIALYRIPGGLPDKVESMLYNDEIERLVNVTLGHETEYGRDKAEGLTLTEDNELLVVYDAPASHRLKDESDAYADIFTYPEGKSV
uniref:DUF3616 domain-containing protein n=1 Tax=Roseihalotalea indica TaxID=2867963 RepID=A0AA49GIL4_9BACT|nr:DUF3616 domain-containing protein [Tunicatimonas sp. TK19036]